MSTTYIKDMNMQFFKRKFDKNEYLTNAQRGAMIMDNLVAVGFISMLVIGIVASIPALTHKLNVTKFQSQVNEITTAAVQWKKQRPNYDKLTIGQLCDYELISKTLCSGVAGASATTTGVVNSFGGTFALTGNGGTFSLDATLPNLTGESGRQKDLADTMAPSTKGQCLEAQGCLTITSTTDALNMEF
ncbi:hypothetical protein ACTTZI_004177 [Vibrio vulnificus]